MQRRVGSRVSEGVSIIIPREAPADSREKCESVATQEKQVE